MKRFVWRLQRVLDMRIIEERRRRVELLEITERLAESRGELLTRQRMLKDIISGITGKTPRKRLGEQELFMKYSAASDEHIKRLKSKICELEKQQREKTAEVLRVQRCKEGLERLRAEAKRQFTAEQEKLEQKELDEMAGISFNRKKRGSIEMV